MKKGKLRRSAGETRKLGKRQNNRMPILLDTAKIRREYEKLYEKAEVKFARSRELWRTFEETDRPAYQRWFQTSFGRELSELRRLEEEIRAKVLVIDRVNHEHMATGVSFFQAYQRVKRDEDAYMAESRRSARNQCDDPGDEDPGEDAGQGYAGRDFDEDDFDELDDEFYEEVKRMYANLRDAFFGSGDGREREEDIDDFMSGFRRGGGNLGKRLKEAYRKFCKIMHPDTGAAFDERAAALWNDAQIAYEDRDLDKLEALLVIAEAGGEGFTPKTSCSQILDAIEHIEEEAGSLDHEIMRAKRDPAWKFTSTSKRKKENIEQRAHKELAQQLSRMKAQFAGLQAQIARWEEPPPARVRKKQPPPPLPANLIQLELGF